MVAHVSPVYGFRYGGVVINVYHANVGEGLQKHSHEYSHLTMCHAGKLRITKEHRVLELTKDSNPVNLREVEWHELEALEDGTVFVNIFKDLSNSGD